MLPKKSRVLSDLSNSVAHPRNIAGFGSPLRKQAITKVKDALETSQEGKRVNSAVLAEVDKRIDSLPDYIAVLSNALRSSNESLEVCHRALHTVNVDETKMNAAFARHMAVMKRARRRERNSLRGINHGLRVQLEELKEQVGKETHDEKQALAERTARAEALVGETRERYLSLETEWKNVCTRLAQKEAKLAIQTKNFHEMETRLSASEAKYEEAERNRAVSERQNAEMLRRLDILQAESSSRIAEETMAKYRLEESVNGLRDSLKKVQTEIVSVASERDSLQQQLNKLRETIAEKEKEVAHLFTSNSNLKIRIEEERRNTLEATAQVRAFQNSLREMETRAANEVDTFQKALDSARTDVGRSTTERNQALHAVDLSAKVIRDFQDRITALVKRAEDAENRAEAENHKVQLGVRRLEAAEGIAAELRLQIEAGRLALKEAEARIVIAEDQASASREEKRALEDRLQEELARWRALFEEEVTRSQLLLEEQIAKNERLERDLGTKVEELVRQRDEAVASLEGAKARGDEFEAQATTIATEIMAMEVEYARVVDELKEAKGLLNEQLTMIEDQSSKLNLLHKAVDSERSLHLTEKTKRESLEEMVKGLKNEKKARELQMQNNMLVHGSGSDSTSSTVINTNTTTTTVTVVEPMTLEAQLESIESAVAEGMTAFSGPAVQQLSKLYQQLSGVLPEALARAREQEEAKEQIAKLTEQEKTLALAVQKESDKDHKIEQLYTLYMKEKSMKKYYSRQLAEINGNIRVHLRIKPRLDMASGSAAEAQGNPRFIKAWDDGETVTLEGANKDKTFAFDRVYGEDATQEKIFEDVEPIISSVFEGESACVMVYGQTGSGKTYTMFGPQGNPGLIARSIHSLYEMMQRPNMSAYHVNLSMVQIYNNDVYDLIHTFYFGDEHQCDLLEEKVSPNADGEYYENYKVNIVGQKEISRIESEKDCVEYISNIIKIRNEKLTRMNENSSRSHVLIYLNLYKKNGTPSGDDAMVGQLVFVDLAGSESVDKTIPFNTAQASTLMGSASANQASSNNALLFETKNINQSLYALGDVLFALSAKQRSLKTQSSAAVPHIPYRHSKLTHLLKPLLEHSRTAFYVLVCVSNELKNERESRAGVVWADRIKKIEKKFINQNSQQQQKPVVSIEASPAAGGAASTPSKVVILEKTPKKAAPPAGRKNK